MVFIELLRAQDRPRPNCMIYLEYQRADFRYLSYIHTKHSFLRLWENNLAKKVSNM